jgi:hypothetical protein
MLGIAAERGCQSGNAAVTGFERRRVLILLEGPIKAQSPPSKRDSSTCCYSSHGHYIICQLIMGRAHRIQRKQLVCFDGVWPFGASRRHSSCQLLLWPLKMFQNV